MLKNFLKIIVFFYANIVFALDFPNEKEIVKVEIIPNNGVFFKDNQYFFGIKFKLTKGWKTYWKNPGDAGAPLSINWEDERKLDELEVLYPFPEKFIDKGVSTIGYADEVIFPIKVNPSNKEKILEEIRLDYLVCKDICIPISEVRNVNINYENLVKSKEFEENFKLVPKKNKDHFSLIPTDFSTNKFTLRIDNKLKNKIELKVFGYSQETSLKVEKKVDSHFDFLLDEDLKNLNKPISIFVSDGNQIEEILFNLEDIPNKTGVLYFLLLAIIGGLILNLMPCVLPVISLKIYSFLNMYKEKKIKIRTDCSLIILGIFTSFLFLSLTIIILKTFGNSVGWGFQFQNLYFLIFITILILLFSLNLLGFYEITLPSKFLNIISDSLKTKNKIGHFFTGMFATLLATPCSAPLLGTAVGFSMAASNLEILIIFTGIAVGFSFPYYILILFPKIISLFPKPGEWMINFRFFLGILLLLSSTWFMSLLNLNKFIILSLLIFIICLSYINSVNKFKKFILIITTLGSILFFLEPLLKKEDELIWEKFNETLLNRYLNEDRVILVDVTADWCVTCKFNKMTTLNSNKVKDYIMNNDIVILRADWTNKDPEILNYIKKFNRYGIPVNTIYGPDTKEGILLPEIISKDMLLNKLIKVGSNENSRE